MGNASAKRRDAYAYDPAANRWRRLARPPQGLVSQQAIWTGNRLVVLGGDEVTRAFAYDPKRDRWTSSAAPAARGARTERGDLDRP